MFARMMALVAVGALALWLRYPPPRDLLQYATKRIDVQSADSYSWLSDTELLVQTNTSRASDPSGRWSGYFEIVAFQTGKRRRLDGLTTAIMRHANHYDARRGPLMFVPSPTGEWLFWQCLGPTRNADRIVTARLDKSLAGTRESVGIQPYCVRRGSGVRVLFEKEMPSQGVNRLETTSLLWLDDSKGTPEC